MDTEKSLERPEEEWGEWWISKWAMEFERGSYRKRMKLKRLKLYFEIQNKEIEDLQNGMTTIWLLE